MSTTVSPADADVRARALDVDSSFIVQAPAGSGKTELLIQRYLRLLTRVDEPEEILAITFTRKAAGEMRQRIEDSLDRARNDDAPADRPHLMRGYELARAVIARDGERGWGLGDQPARLRISTIDSLNMRLSRRVPLTAGFTSRNLRYDDATPLYRDAARDALACASGADENAAALRRLLAHCGNDGTKVEDLLQAMLARRDQWLAITGGGVSIDFEVLRARLEASLRQVIEHYLHDAARLLPIAERKDLVACLAHAGRNLNEHYPEKPGAAWYDTGTLPGATPDELPRWRALAWFLLTRNKGRYQWRSSPNKTLGFPPDKGRNAEQKACFVELLGRLQSCDELRAALATVHDLPDPAYSDAQWSVIEALWKALPLSVAALKTLFTERGRTDHTEIAQEAIDALGTDEAVSDLRLALDYQIRHILMDEFQDTSRSQYELVRTLTSGWEAEPGRSLFLVGDPMQSIYRFREAEVGLFLETWEQQHIGDVPVEPLQLTTNFRSRPAIVAWFNEVFARLFPASNDLQSGATAFARSEPWWPGDAGNDAASSGVHWHAVQKGDRDGEAGQIAARVAETLAAHPDDSIGILVRSRTHATALAGRLRADGIAYVATGLEQLTEQPAVHDLLALTRALTHAGDRLAWLACLRAPWCGLTLHDLHALAAHDHKACIPTLLADAASLERLTADGQARLARCWPVLEHGFGRRGTLPVRDLVEAAWRRLGGPETLASADACDAADRYFAFLSSLDLRPDIRDGAELLELLGKHAIDRGEAPQVQILTMHKAKGLEFDTIILPGLGRQTRASSRPLLLFDAVTPGTDGGMVIAPIKASGEARDEIFDLLWTFECERERLEQDRLLYVAVTRAKQRLHLYAELELHSDGDAAHPPASNTLLARLWPVANAHIHSSDLKPRAQKKAGEERQADWHAVALRRLPDGWQVPDAAPRIVPRPARGREPDAPVEFAWASTWAKHVGSVVHRWLQLFADEGAANWSADRIAASEPRLRLALRRAGVANEDLPRAVRRTIEALDNVLADERGRWLLSDQHIDAASEFELTTGEGGRFANYIVDRTFVTQDGERWIVDYKTSTHEGGDADAFLVSEGQRYRQQLRRYRDAFARFDDRPIRTALYFPLLRRLHEVDCDGSE